MNTIVFTFVSHRQNLRIESSSNKYGMIGHDWHLFINMPAAASGDWNLTVSAIVWMGGEFEYGREEVISCSFESLLGRQETSSETFPVVQEGGDLFGRIQCEAWPLRLAWNFCQQECAVSTGGQWHAACLQISLVGRGNCVQLWNWREPWGCPVCGWAEHSEG